jgi:sugar lactone lactonase YvrE
LLALQGGLARFDLNNNKLTWLLDIEKEYQEHRCNDGCCDPRGRLWVGTLHMQFKKGAGSLYCINEHLEMSKKLDNLTISNGMAWSPDGTRMYFIDSPTQTVQQFISHEEKATISFEKIAIHIPKDMGAPDGMAIDEEGMLWIAHYGGFGVYRWDPVTGKQVDSIKLPVPNVTSCAFVGEDLDHLLITTASQELSEEECIKFPQSGHVFIARLPVRGVKGYDCLI